MGRSSSKANPVPPPAFWMSAVCLIESKIPSIESGTGRTKHALNMPIDRPAFISVGLLGMNRQDVISRLYRVFHAMRLASSAP